VIDCLITGRLQDRPQQRLTKANKPFATCTIKASMRDTEGLIYVRCIAFNEGTVSTLMALEDGAAVAIAGELKVGIYTPNAGGEPRPSLDLVLHQVLTEYRVSRKRKAVQAGQGEVSDPGEASRQQHDGQRPLLDRPPWPGAGLRQPRQSAPAVPMDDRF
jgi:hypothetical protein